MSLFEDLEREAQVLSVATPGCKTCLWLQTLEDRERAKIDQWYRDDLPHLSLWRILRRYGFPGSDTGLRRHRDQCIFKDQAHVD